MFNRGFAGVVFVALAGAPFLLASESGEHGISPAVPILMAVAVLAPFLNELPIPLRLPAVVLETVFGILIGPQVLGWVEPDAMLQVAGTAGMGMLFFMAGMELQFDRLRGLPIHLGTVGWLASAAIALAAGFGLRATGLVDAPVLVGLAMTTTAMGPLIPILKDGGDLDTPFGKFLLAAASMGEFGPIAMISLIVAKEGGRGTAALLLLAFLIIAIGSGWMATRLRTPAFFGFMERHLYASSQLPVRLSLLLLALLLFLAGRFGLDVILGAFAAGMLVSLVSHGEHLELLHHKLEGIGFGFLIPIFFILTGVRFDLKAVLASPASIAKVPLFLALFFVVRGLPCLFLYRKHLSGRDARGLALYASMQLPLVVAITEIGKQTGRMRPDNAAALVAAGMLSLLLFPTRAAALRKA